MARKQQGFVWVLVALQTCAPATQAPMRSDDVSECAFGNIMKCLEKQVRWIPKRFNEQPLNRTATYGVEKAFFNEICRRSAEECWKTSKSDGCPADQQDSLRRFRNASNAALETLCEHDMSLLKDLFLYFPCWDMQKFTRCSTAVSPKRAGELFSVARANEDCRAYQVKMQECVQHSYQQTPDDLCGNGNEHNATEAASSLLAAFLRHMKCQDTPVHHSSRESILTTPPNAVAQNGTAGGSLQVPTDMDGISNCSFDKIVKCLERQVRWIPKRFSEKHLNRSAHYDIEGAFFNEICRQNVGECWKHSRSDGCPADQQDSLGRFRAANNAALESLCEHDMSLLKGLFLHFPCWDLEKFAACTAAANPARVGGLFSAGRPQEECGAYQIKVRECVQESYQQTAQGPCGNGNEHNATEAASSVLDAFFSHMNCQGTPLHRSPSDSILTSPITPFPPNATAAEQSASSGASRHLPSVVTDSADNTSQNHGGTTAEAASVETTSEFPCTGTVTATRSFSLTEVTDSHPYFVSRVTAYVSTADPVNERVKKIGRSVASSREGVDAHGGNVSVEGTNKYLNNNERVDPNIPSKVIPTTRIITGNDRDEATSGLSWSPVKVIVLGDRVPTDNSSRTTAALRNMDETTTSKHEALRDRVDDRSTTNERPGNLTELTSALLLHAPMTSAATDWPLYQKPSVAATQEYSSPGLADMSDCRNATCASKPASGEVYTEAAGDTAEPDPLHVTVDGQMETTVQISPSNDDEHTSAKPTKWPASATTSSSLSISLITTTSQSVSKSSSLSTQALPSLDAELPKEKQDNGDVSAGSRLAASKEISAAASARADALTQTLLSDALDHMMLSITEKDDTENPSFTNEQLELQAEDVVNAATPIEFSASVFSLLAIFLLT